MYVGHMVVEEFTIHFCPRDWGVHLLSFACKVNTLLMPEEEGLEVSNDWYIIGHKNATILTAGIQNVTALVKDVCANCFCASLLRTQIHVAMVPCHSSSICRQMYDNFARIFLV